MIKKSNKTIVFLFVFFILFINILNIAVKDKKFSQIENRVLSQFPKMSFENLISGKFTNKFEDYMSDHFVFRNYWVGIKSDAERIMLKTKNNGIFFGQDGFLLEDYKKTDKQLFLNIESLNTFVEELPSIKTHFLLVPNSIKIYEDKLPLFATPYNQLNTIEVVKETLSKSIDFIDVYTTLNNNKDDYIYYKTDHHWTMKGAFYAYETLSEHFDFTPYSIKYFKSEIVSNSFYGTFYSKALNNNIKPDSIEIFKPSLDISYKVHYKDNDILTDSLYEYSHLDKKDKYSLFLDGNHALTTISTNVNNNNKIVIFKDSYAHSFIPFLANHYKEIHIIDLRYYNLNIYEYVLENDIEEALFLYNVSSFSQYNNIESLNIK